MKIHTSTWETALVFRAKLRIFMFYVRFYFETEVKILSSIKLAFIDKKFSKGGIKTD